LRLPSLFGLMVFIGKEKKRVIDLEFLIASDLLIIIGEFYFRLNLPS